MADEGPLGRIDRRFSDPKSDPTAWADVVALLQGAELFWLSTVRADVRPHVTPLIGVWHNGAMYITTGLQEQKAHNLEQHSLVALTTGINKWAEGLDVVLEANASRVTDQGALLELGNAYVVKYGSSWEFDVGDGVFGSSDRAAAVFQIRPTKVLAFAKNPHSQRTFRV